MIQFTSTISEKYRNALVFSSALLFCLLFMRFIILIVEFFSISVQFRMMMGLDVVFVFIIPIILVFMLANKMELSTSFFLPLVVYGLIFPICDALFLDPFTLLVYPQYFITFLIGGIGFGLIGLSGKIYPGDLLKSLMIYSFGISIIMINSFNIIPVLYYVVTGDMTPLQQISNFF